MTQEQFNKWYQELLDSIELLTLLAENNLIPRELLPLVEETTTKAIRALEGENHE